MPALKKVGNTYLRFSEVPYPWKKTGTYLVYSAAFTDRPALGIVKWWPGWRRYCFFPSAAMMTIFDAQCLQEVADFINNQMDFRKIRKEKHEKLSGKLSAKKKSVVTSR